MAVIRVLHILTTLNIGGAESMVMNYYRQIDKSKIQFDFLLHRDAKGHFEDEVIKLGGKIFKVQPINPFFPNNYYKELRHFFKTNEYQIVHSHLNASSCFTLKIAKELNIPYRIAHAHTSLPKLSFNNLFSRKEIVKNLKNVTKQRLRLRLRVSGYATHHFSCGDKAGRWLFGNDIDFTVLNNAIDSSKFIYNDEIAKQYKLDNNLKDEFIIGHIGNFTPPKNHDFLLKVFNEILKLNKNSKLILIGDGPAKEKVMSQAKYLSLLDNIIFLGLRRDIPNLCQIFNVFIFPSLYEGLPVSLIEAQAAGLKIFASDSITKEVEITESIEFLSIMKAPEYWAKKVLEKKYSKLNNHQKIIESGYDIKSNSIELEKFYSKLN